MTLELTLINDVTMPVLGLVVFQRTPDVLDRIDQLVAPGATINPEDDSYGAHELTPRARRR